MRVVTEHPANLSQRTWRIALRTAVYSVPDSITFALVTALNSPLILSWGAPQGESDSRFTLDAGSGLPLLLTALLFASARRRNGWMALHDWLSGTRVVVVVRSSAGDVIGTRPSAPRSSIGNPVTASSPAPC
jgi:hypothetical protein